MKLLKQYLDTNDAEADAARLEARGIVTYVSAKHSQKMSSVLTGAIKTGLWVLIDEQYQDAYQLLQNSNHNVTTGLNPKEAQKIRASARSLVYQQLNKTLVYGVILAVIMVVVFLWINSY